MPIEIVISFLFGLLYFVTMKAIEKFISKNNNTTGLIEIGSVISFFIALFLQTK